MPVFLRPFFSKCKRRVVSQRRLRAARAFSTCSVDPEKIRHKKSCAATSCSVHRKSWLPRIDDARCRMVGALSSSKKAASFCGTPLFFEAEAVAR
jgi:hypothetical protein